MESKCIHDTMASNYSTKFHNESQTNAMGENSSVHKSETNEKAHHILNDIHFNNNRIASSFQQHKEARGNGIYSAF